MNIERQQVLLEKSKFDLSKQFYKYLTYYFTNDSSNCFETLCIYRALTRKLALNDVGNSLITDISNDIVKYENVEISIDKLRYFFNVLIDEFEDLLYNKLLQTNKNEIKSLINIQDLQDNLHEEKNDFYFVNHDTNIQNFDKCRKFLINKIIKKDSTFHKYFFANSVHIKHSKLSEYLNFRKQGLFLLLSIVYLTTDSLARDEEIILTKFKNDINAGSREVFFDQNSQLIMFNLRYHKNQSKQRQNSRNIRYLNSRASEL